MSKKQTVLRIILLVALSLIIGFGAYSCNARKIAGDPLPMPFGIGMAVVISGSMEPELSIDDVVIVKASDDYNVGETVVYQDGYSLTVHKIIKKDGDTVTTKGVANNTADKPINVSDIKGKVVFTVPKIGIVVDFIKSPIVTFSLVGLAAYLLFRSYRKEQDNDEKELDELKAEIERLKNERNQNK